MSTILADIRTRARRQLVEETVGFWSDSELEAHIVSGIRDLWGALIDLHQWHFATIDATNVSMAANTSTLTGVPTDVFRVLLIEPRDLTSGVSGSMIEFIPREYNSSEFINARAWGTAYPYQYGARIFYAVTLAGAPVAAPTIQVAPTLSSALNLRLVYIPTLASASWADFSSATNPIPGESDHALFAWCMAYARGKERDDGSPDPNWLAVYATEKQGILTRLTPRQEQEPEEVPSLFEN